MFFRELNHAKCKTYLLACESARRAALVDPIVAQEPKRSEGFNLGNLLQMACSSE